MKQRTNISKYLHDAYVWLAVIGALVSLIYPYLRYADFALSPLLLGLVASVLGALFSAYAIRLRERIRSRNAPRVFISYAHEDAKLALDIAKRLETMGARPVIDKFELAVGDDIAVAVKRLVEGADYYLVVLSPAFMKSSWANQELEAALNLEKRVLPVLLTPEAIPERLRGVVYADFTGSPDVGFEGLERTLTKHGNKEA